MTGLLLSCSGDGDDKPHRAEIADDAVFMMRSCGKENWVQHMPLLYRAADIRRHSPECPLVTRVTLSEEATIDNPKVRTVCQKGKGLAAKTIVWHYTADRIRDEFSKLPDPIEDELYLAPVAENAVFDTGNCKGRYQGNIPYLYYVMEIQRRRTACKKIHEVKISGGSKLQPVFAVTCTGSDGAKYTDQYNRPMIRERYAAIFNVSPAKRFPRATAFGYQ